MELQAFHEQIENASAKLETEGVRLLQIKSDGIEEELKEWKRTEVNIAVIGNSGSGKSSFINALRGLQAEDKDAAKVGYIETTTECRRYPHPKNEKVVIWDLPGVGTPSFPKKKYLKKTEFKKYDFYIIVSHSRFTENDAWLVKNVRRKERGKLFYFVWTHVDNDMENHRRSFPNSEKSRDEILREIRHYCNKLLQTLQVRDVKLFLVDSYNRTEYDFDALCSQLVNDALGTKMEALAFTLFIRTLVVMDSKRRNLQARIWKKCFSATVASGSKDFRDILQDEVEFYREQFGVAEDDIESLTRLVRKSKDVIRSELKLSTSVEAYTITEIDHILEQLAVKYSKLLPNYAQLFVRLGVSGVSYVRYFLFLQDALTKAYNDAISINRFYQQNLTRDAYRQKSLL